MSCPYRPRPTPVLVPRPCSAWQQHGSSSSQCPARILERRRGPKGRVGGSGDTSPRERPRLDCIPDAFLFKLGFKGFLVGFGFWGFFFFGREITFLEGLRRFLWPGCRSPNAGRQRSGEAREARVAIGWADGAGTGCLPRPPPWEGSRGPGVLLAPPTPYPTKGQPAREGSPRWWWCFEKGGGARTPQLMLSAAASQVWEALLGALLPRESRSPV